MKSDDGIIARLKTPLALGAALAVGFAAQSFAAETTAAQASPPKLRVLVDPRVELASLIFRLAGNNEYNQGRVPSYTADVEKQFGAFRDHPAVKLARELRQTRGVSFDAPMSLAVLLNGVSDPKLAVPLDPWPESLDRRWTSESVTRFVSLVGQFAKESRFQEFFDAHRALYETAVARFQKVLSKEAHLEWFKEFFGERPGAEFTVVLGMLNGGCCYGPHARDMAGHEELFCILGVWATDSQGAPVFEKDALPTVVHEFCHSYANPIIDRHLAELRESGEKLYGIAAEQMKSQAYGEAATMLRESLVRAAVVRYMRRYEGTTSADREISDQVSRGFAWMGDLSSLLGEYEAQRDRYPTLDSFSPRLAAFFAEAAKKEAALDAKRPKVLSMVPANGADDVDPGLKAIHVVFDRPMQDGSWAMVGGGPKYPETSGKPNYDAKRTTWTVPVKLKPNWEYEFWLNAGRFQTFQSEEGVPLKSVHVTFKTGPAPQQ